MGPQGLWLRLAELETKYGNAESLDNVPGAEVRKMWEDGKITAIWWKHLGGLKFSISFFGHISKICEIM